MMVHRVLILGGTGEARQLSERLADDKRFDVTISLAGRTRHPVAHPVVVRSGGFGGTDGLARYLRSADIDILIDATHPFAERISGNARAAAEATQVSLIRLERPAWEPVVGDRWRFHHDVAATVGALGDRPKRVFVTLGRQELAPLEAAPQHFYLIRSVDPVEPRLRLPHAAYILARGPFEPEAEIALLREHAIEVIISKNSGGAAARAKLEAARRLGIAVEMIVRPTHPVAGAVQSVDAALAALDHVATSMKERGE